MVSNQSPSKNLQGIYQSKPNYSFNPYDVTPANPKDRINMINPTHSAYFSHMSHSGITTTFSPPKISQNDAKNSIKLNVSDYQNSQQYKISSYNNIAKKTENIEKKLDIARKEIMNEPLKKDEYNEILDYFNNFIKDLNTSIGIQLNNFFMPEHLNSLKLFENNLIKEITRIYSKIAANYINEKLRKGYSSSLLLKIYEMKNQLDSSFNTFFDQNKKILEIYKSEIDKDIKSKSYDLDYNLGAMKKENETLKQKMNSYTSEIQDLKQKNSELQSKLKIMQTELNQKISPSKNSSSKDKAIYLQTEEIKKLKTKIEDLTNENNLLRQNSSKNKSENSKIISEDSDYKKYLALLYDTIVKSGEKDEKFSKENINNSVYEMITAWTNLNKISCESLNAINEVKTQCENEINKLKTENEQLKKNLSKNEKYDEINKNLMQKCETLEKNIENLKDENGEINETLCKVKNENEKLLLDKNSTDFSKEDLEQLSKINQNLHAKFKNLSENLEKLRKENSEQVAKNCDSTSDNSFYKNQLEKSNENIHSLENKKTELENEIKKLHKEIENKEQEIISKNNEIKIIESNLVLLSKNDTDLSKENLEHLSKINQNLYQGFKNLSENLEKLRKENSDQVSKILDLTNQIADHKDLLSKTAENKDTLIVKNSELESEIKKLQKEIENKEQEVINKNNEIKTTQSILALLDKNNNDFISKEDLEALSKINQNLYQKFANLNENLEKLRTENREQSSKISDLAKQITDYKNLLEKTNENNGASITKNSELENEIKKLQEEIKNKEQEIKSKNNEINVIKINITLLNEIIDTQNQEKISEIEKLQKDFNSKCNNLSTENNDLKLKIVKLQETINSLNEQLKSLPNPSNFKEDEELIKSLKDKNNELENENEKILKQISAKDQEINNFKSKITDFEEKIKNSSKSDSIKNTNLIAENQNLKTQIEEFKKSLKNVKSNPEDEELMKAQNERINELENDMEKLNKLLENKDEKLNQNIAEINELKAQIHDFIMDNQINQKNLNICMDENKMLIDETTKSFSIISESIRRLKQEPEKTRKLSILCSQLKSLIEYKLPK